MTEKTDTPDLHALMETALREQWQNGDGKALLYAVRDALAWNRPVPDWAREAFITSVDDVVQERVRSWDQAFGAPFEKGKHLKEGRTHDEIACYLTGQRILSEDKKMKTDKGLFEAIAEFLNVSPSYAERRYYDGKRRLEPYLNI
ncbi:hypothetical protein L2D01_06580 [Hyphomonadaceae bacterium ML37]|nr:hypothetical protein L2D01_06580 [Hyphomonadaceae bacterium ML37]